MKKLLNSKLKDMKAITLIAIIISFIIGLILTSSIAVYAYSYLASEISYTKPGTEAPISVETALNDLYSKKNKISAYGSVVNGNQGGAITKYSTDEDYITITGESAQNPPLTLIFTFHKKMKINIHIDYQQRGYASTGNVKLNDTTIYNVTVPNIYEAVVINPNNSTLLNQEVNENDNITITLNSAVASGVGSCSLLSVFIDND